MDPAAIASVTAEVYKVGGIVLVLLFLLVLGSVFVVRFLMRMINDMGTRINDSEKEKVAILTGVVANNTEALQEVVFETKNQTAAFSSVVEVLGGRPCLVETDRYHKRPSLSNINPNPALHQRD